MAVHFCTFGSLPNYRRSLMMIHKEAARSGYFSSVNIYTQDNIPSTEEEKEFMKAYPRGYGYWVWKSTIILDQMEKRPENDFIVYADAGCGIRPGVKHTLDRWIHLTREHPTHRLAFQINTIEKEYTKDELFSFLNCDTDDVKNTCQYMGGVQIYQNTPENKEFLRKYKQILSFDNYHYISDEPSRLPNAPNFKDHRHDQSVLSLMYKLHGVCTLSGSEVEQNATAPIQALRRRCA